MIDDLTAMTDDDLDSLRIAVLNEQERRRIVIEAGPSVRATIVAYMGLTGATKADVEVIASEVLASIPDQTGE